MRFSFKKALATVLSIALVFSTCVCALTVGAATPAGSISVVGGTVELTDGKFDTTAQINLAEATDFVYVAYQLDLPDEVTLVSAASAVAGAEITVKAEKDTILVHVQDSVQAIPVVMTFATTKESGDLTIGIANVEFAEGSEEDLTLTIGEAAKITIAHTCVGADPVVENEVAATCGVAGSYDSVVKCSVCDAEITRTKVDVPATGEHNYVGGACDVCGEAEPVTGPVLDESLQFRDINVTVTDTVNIRYRVYAETTKGINGYATLGYDHVEVIVYGKEYSFVSGETLYNEVDFAEVQLEKSTTSAGSNHMFNGIAMISLGLEINAYIKAYDADGNCVAYSPAETITTESKLRENLANAKTDTAKATIIELLNMAAAAQIKFAGDKAGTDLAKAVAEGKLVNKDLPESIVTELPEFNIAEGVANWAEGVDETFKTDHKLTVAVPINVSPGIRIYVAGKDTLDTSKLKVVFSYYDPNPSVKDTVYKTVEGVDASVSGKRLAFNVPNLEFHNANAIITASVYYDGSVVATFDYSLETYVAEKMTDTSSQAVKDLAAAIAKFGLAFRMNKGIVS